ncbi:MAG TPA: Druantia anti-phage system protein DruA [Thermoanaerobaculia bacterium]|nr:Druantia anti-phage system protein DruA [Thermoanaerobaculia bacterium]
MWHSFAALFAPNQEIRARTSSLRTVQVRLLYRGEKPTWNRLMREHHYLGFQGWVGESLRYVAEWEGRWVALVGWCAAALKCGARDRWIGWPELELGELPPDCLCLSVYPGDPLPTGGPATPLHAPRAAALGLIHLGHGGSQPSCSWRR